MSVINRLKAALKAERYELERELGRGSMGRVYLAKDLRHDRSVAVKVLEPNFVSATGGARFLREIQITAGLQHPHILPLLDSGESDDLVYYIMPHVDGETLREHLAREKQLTVTDAVRIAGQVASALAYAHEQGVIHRDIKPDNILLSAGMAMVADFGIARALSSRHTSTQTTSAGTALGTPAYMSPEQAAGDPVDHRSDIYSLGVVLFEMITGKPPLVGDSISATIRLKLTEPMPLMSSFRAGLPPSLDAIVQRATARDPEQRFQTAKELGDALEPLLAREALVGTALDSPRLQLEGTATAVGKTVSAHRVQTSHRLIIWGGLVGAMIILGLVLSGQLHSSGRKTPNKGRAVGAVEPQTDNRWGRRPLTGKVAVVPLRVTGQDSLAGAVANGFWEDVNRRVGGRFELQSPNDSASGAGDSRAEVLIQGSIARDGPDLVAGFDWISLTDNSRFWSESYHFPPGQADVRSAIIDRLVGALAVDSTR